MFEIVTDRSIDSLEQELVACQAGKAHLVSRQVELLRRLDVAQVALADGRKTMVDWVASRLDVPHRVARDLLFVARAHDRVVEDWLESGEVGLERAVAMIRLRRTGASPRVDSGVVGVGFGWSVAAGSHPRTTHP